MIPAGPSDLPELITSLTTTLRSWLLHDGPPGLASWCPSERLPFRDFTAEEFLGRTLTIGAGGLRERFSGKQSHGRPEGRVWIEEPLLKSNHHVDGVFLRVWSLFDFHVRARAGTRLLPHGADKIAKRTLPKLIDIRLVENRVVA
jgi:hypothetical protein